MIRLFALLFLSAFTTVSIAGAWTPGKGKTYLKISANLFESYANYDIDGNIVDPFEGRPGEFSRFRDENLFVYFETGLSDRLALFGSLTYKDIEQKTVTEFFEVSATNSGLADAEIGLRYRLRQTGRNVWSVSLLAKLPYFYDDDDNFFELGNGQEDFEGRILYGRSLPHGFYAGLEAGYRVRLEDPSDAYRYLAELGWSGGKVYARAKYDGNISVDDADEVGGFSNPILNPQFDLESLELTLGYSFTRIWHLEYSYTDTVSGKNTAEGDNQQVAVVLSF
ncbi:MAG: hypothetical protein QNK37_36155 [Acidobacteriota bacterium]|nr:hypothetical protein [Acidobacteriota bacterium]